eukprot:scaffold22755_cov59-Phaeocystis_antarctica.AAC.1
MLGTGGQVDRVPAAAEGRVAARGRGQRVRELVPRDAGRHAARRARLLHQAEGAAGGGRVLLGVRLRDPADRRQERPGVAWRLRQRPRAHGAADGALARAQAAQARLLHQGGLPHAGKRSGVRHGHEYEGAGELQDGARDPCFLGRDQGGAVEGGRAAGVNTTLTAPL